MNEPNSPINMESAVPFVFFVQPDKKAALVIKVQMAEKIRAVEVLRFKAETSLLEFDLTFYNLKLIASISRRNS